jgi:replicative DNA helicase
VYSVAEKRGGEDYHALGELLNETMEEIEAAAGRTDEFIGVPTGFLELDELTNGLHAGQMIVIAARPAVGKSTLGIDIARAAAIKHNMATAVFSLEMSRTEITMRILSAEATIQLQDLRKGLKSQDQWNKLARIMGKISDSPLFIDDSPNMSLMEIRAKCRRLKQQHNLKMVIIDYLQLMSSARRSSRASRRSPSSRVRSSCSPRSSRFRSSRSAS